MAQHHRDLVPAQDHRKALWLLGAHHVVQPANVLLEDLLIQKQNGAESLALSRGGDVAFDRQMR
jgi:hypothetical protein